MASIILEQEGPIASVRLNRPEVRNALNEELIRELGEAFQKIEKDPSVRLVILSGEGGTFCAGADLHWMKSLAGATREANEADAKRFSGLLRSLNLFPKPVIAQVQGAAIGGGIGLVAIADIAIADEETVFALAEVKLGLLPAIISPYVIAKIGVSAARRYILTGERFDAETALRYRLIHEAVEGEDLQGRCHELAKELLSSGPEAIKAGKALIQKVAPPVNPEIEEYTLQKLSELRSGPEGEEGIRSFFEKRKPNWQ